MSKLKARIKGTDRVIEVVTYSRDNNWIEFEEVVDGQVRYDTRQLDEVELIVDNAPSPIDWEQRKYEIAKDVMTGFVIESTFWSAEQMADESVRHADALIEKLKGGEQ